MVLRGVKRGSLIFKGPGGRGERPSNVLPMRTKRSIVVIGCIWVGTGTQRGSRMLIVAAISF